jgi:hypothetical protein
MLLPWCNPTLPPILGYGILHIYRADSDGWNIKANCYTCRAAFEDIIRPFTSCVATDTCRCNVRIRQPTSLLASATHVVYHHVFNLTRFELSPCTTYDTYVYAVNSNRVDSLNLLPPEFPFIRVFFSYKRPNRRFHFSCPGMCPWNAYHESMFENVAMAVHELVTYRDVYWCEQCDRPLFFPCSCSQYPE